MMQKLIQDVFVQAFGDVQLEDAASITLVGSGANEADTQVSFSTDSYVIQPLFFPGGDIGRIAVCGTVNDVATSGSRPLCISVSFILEEGFPLEDLMRIVQSMADTAKEAKVNIVTGDTKVVGKGQADGIFINTTGLGLIPSGKIPLRAATIQPGDAIVLSGSLGDHGMCIMSQREELSFAADIASDAAPLNHMMAAVLAAAPDTRCFRDPTRGGLASTLNELADAAKVHMTIEERTVPVKSSVQGACEMLGYDVFQVANEGKIVAIVPDEQATAALDAMKASPYGKDAAIIGRVESLFKEGICEDGSSIQGGFNVQIRNAFGATRVMDTLVGEQLPRIC
ncbi:MAG: hydrogenase expression/formation protein HypE [Coriobacteriia bacterium]|nr:hydrogenase expression/formation protein HypE [Coriobacteriia bacterium]